MFRPRRRLLKLLLARADAARDQHLYRLAAELYDEASRAAPERADLHVQCANMLKESGQFAAAEQRYRRAGEQGADRGDLALQLGHLHKVAGRLDDARRAYRSALDIDPGLAAARDELAKLTPDRGGPIDAEAPDRSAVESDREWTLDELGRLVPSLAPWSLPEKLVRHDEAIEIRRLGRREEGGWGIRRTVRGIEAVHGFILSESPIAEVAIIVNGIEIARDAVRGGYPVRLELDAGRIAKYVFNCWVDFSAFRRGLYAVELRFAATDGRPRSWHDQVVIGEPVPEDRYPDSDFLIASDPDDRRAVEAQIRQRPSQVRNAVRTPFPGGLERVLVLRTDQLGDLVASLPALRRLRQLLPHAQIVGMVTDANADFARTLADVFDEVLVIDFPDIPIEQRRVMPLDQQEQLRERLHAYRFDLAIDLARAGVSRELLRLSGARFLYGVGGGDWPFLSAEFVFNTRDRWTGHDRTPHSAKVLAMIEALGTILAGPAPMVRRDDLSPDLLRRYDLAPDERYVVLHLGARIGFSQWPHHGALAQSLLDQTDLKIVAIGDAGAASHFPEGVRNSARVRLLDRRLPFDDLDALLSFATVMVGNDSGPKHLAALRGTPVVTIFSARINWTEWAQEGTGVVISRKVPCAGCAILHEPENCGKDFACITDIRPGDVLEQVVRLAAQPRPPTSGD